MLVPVSSIGNPHQWYVPTALVFSITDLLLLIILALTQFRHVQHCSQGHAGIAEHVRSALDAMSAGLVTLDNHGRITLLNVAFASFVGKTSDELLHTKLSDLPWQFESADSSESLPWLATLRDRTSAAGVMAWLDNGTSSRTSFTISCSPIDDAKHAGGALVCFEDVTHLQKEQEELNEALTIVETWRAEMRKHSEHLQRMATEDPLTGCLNRRSFFETLAMHWQLACRDDASLSCLMLDIDYFKLVNDRHGHAMGDLVLEKVADAIRAAISADAAVCRYGGEEFCILVPNADIEVATNQAERVRRAVEAMLLGELHVTVSLGVSSRDFGAESPQGLIEQADKCLYSAKHNGRNQVVRWDNVPAISENRATAHHPQRPGSRTSKDDTLDIEVPFHAVLALIAALEYRDRQTAEHCRRVADLCVLIAGDILPVRECYILETAALLHDIGKIGIPDTILYKPGPLTREEWKTMATHVRLGIEIVATTFCCPLLINIIKHHHTWIAGHRSEVETAAGVETVPWAARVLAVAEAYDAMRLETVYRKPLSQEEAIDELRRCSGTQFDEEIVERLINLLETKAHRSSHSNMPTPPPNDIVVSGRDLSGFGGSFATSNSD